MGANMTTRLLRGGHRVVAFDLNEAPIQEAEAEGAEGARTLDEVVEKLSAPRTVWVMVPAGNPTESTVNALAERLSPGDIIIDGGNSNYKDSQRRAAALKEKGLWLTAVNNREELTHHTPPKVYQTLLTNAGFTKNVITPLARALAPNGRLIGIHSMGNDPGMEIVEAVWPGQNPFTVSRHEILEAVKFELGDEAADYVFSAGSNIESLFNYEMHTLPNEIGSSIGTSTLLAAWNAATYVAQVEDDRLEAAMHDDAYIAVTRNVLKKRGGLWFQNESYTITRK